MLFCIPPDTGGNERGYTVSRTIMLIPTGTSVGLTSVSLGVIRAMERKGVRLSVFKPIAQPRSGGDAQTRPPPSFAPAPPPPPPLNR